MGVLGERLSVRASRRARRAAVAVVVLLGLFLGYLAITRHVVPARRATTCVADARDGSGWQLQVSQAAIAATIAGVASRRAMPTRALTIAYAAALQESGLANLDYGTEDSLGVFQQRPSQGWGTPRQVEDPVYASNRFFAALAAVPGYQHMRVYQAAQAVQHSADGLAYAQWASAGSLLALAFSGQLPHAVWCSYATIPRKASLLAATRRLTGTFGALTVRADGDPARSVQVSSTPQGWAVAAWLVCNAESYGIRYVRYAGYQWLAYTGSGLWSKERVLPGHRTTPRSPAAGDTVVFG